MAPPRVTRLQLLFWLGVAGAVVGMLFLARIRPSWPWFSLWLYGLIVTVGTLSLPAVRASLGISWLRMTAITLSAVCFFNFYLFHVETQRQRSERLEVRGVYLDAGLDPVRIGVGYDDLDVRLEGSLESFDRWMLELQPGPLGGFDVGRARGIDMLWVRSGGWLGRGQRAPALGAELSGRAPLAIPGDSTAGQIQLLREGPRGTLSWAGRAASLSKADALLDRRLSTGLSRGLTLAELDWDSVPNPALAHGLVITRVSRGRSIGRIRLTLPRYRVVSRSEPGDVEGGEGEPLLLAGDTIWVTSAGKTWAFAADHVPGVSRVAAPTAVYFVQRPRPTGWALPSPEACGRDENRCGVISTRSLPPPQPHFDLGGFGLDTTRYAITARLETPRETVRVVGAREVQEFAYETVHPIAARPAEGVEEEAGLLLRLHRAGAGRRGGVPLMLGALYFLILGALFTLSGDERWARHSRSASPSASAAWVLLNLFLVFLGVRLALGLRVAYAPPFYDRAATTAVGLWVTFGTLLIALGRWSWWAPLVWRALDRLERPLSRLFVPGASFGNGDAAAPGVVRARTGRTRFRRPEANPALGPDLSILGALLFVTSVSVLFWQSPDFAASLVVAVVGLGAWLAMGALRPHRSAADLNASPLQVLTADADTASPARTFGLAAGVSVVLALAIQAPELALLPVLAFVGLFGVAHLLDQSGWPAGPEGRAWIVYGVGVTGMLLAVIAFFPRPWISVTVAAAAVTAGALVLRRPGAQPGQPAWTHDAAGATADEVGGYDSAVPGENSPVPGSAVAVIAREDGGRPPSPSRLTVLFAQFLELGRSVFSGLGWVGVVLVLFGLAFLNAQGLPAFVRFALVFVLFLLAIRAGLACRQVLDEGSGSGGLEALGLLVIPVGVLLVFMVFDFGLGLVFFFPMFLTVLLAARVDRLPMRVLGGSALLVALVTFGAWSVLRPSTANLRNDEVGDEGLLRLEELEARLPDGRTVQYDTLLVVADQTRFPAFAPGGFLHDQTVAFNRFQRRRVALSRIRPRMFDRLAAYNPSVFRAYRRGDGSRGVTRTAAAWDLQVPSPFAEEWQGEIRASDVYRGRGLYGASPVMSFRRPTSVTRRVSGRRQRCELRPDSVDVRAYCLSESRVPQVTFMGAVDREREATAVAGWTGLWVDGREVEAGDSIALGAGAVLEIEPLAPLVFGEYWDGVLSTKQWINGRLRRRGASEKPLDMFASLGSGWDGSTSGAGSLELTVDTEASRELSGLLQDFIDRRVPIPVELGMIVIASVPDGAIRAVAEVGRRRIPGRSGLLERFAPGSAVKPILAAAILSQRPELGTLQIPARSGQVSSVLGFAPTRIPFQSTLNCPFPSGGLIGLRYFIRCSNNEYAATLLTAGLWQRDATTLIPTRRGADPAFRMGRRSYASFRPEPAVTGLRVDRSELLGSPLADGMAELFDASVDPVIVDTNRRSQRVWEGLTFTNGATFDAPFAQRPAESRPVLLSGQQDEYSDLALLYRYAYGAWENRWNIFDLATAFGRVVTDRRVRLRFARDGARARDSKGLGLTGQPWYGELLAGLGDVAVDGTASDVRNRWRRAGLPSTVFAKTGTLTEAGGPSPADDLYIKSLLFGVGEGGRNRGPLTCGLVGAVYLEFESGARRGSLPSYQVELARNELGEFLAREWREAGICERTVSDP